VYIYVCVLHNYTVYIHIIHEIVLASQDYEHGYSMELTTRMYNVIISYFCMDIKHGLFERNQITSEM
jgi:hypothetical protein